MSSSPAVRLFAFFRILFFIIVFQANFSIAKAQSNGIDFEQSKGVIIVKSLAWLFSVLFGSVAVFCLGKIILTKRLKNRYDFINQQESNYLWISSVLLVVSLFFWILFFLDINETHNWIISSVIGTGVCGGLIYGLYIYFKFHYPSLLVGRLEKLRYRSRISKAGNKMTLLNEDEEDVYLDEGMQQEENVFSVNYDVWIDKETNEVRIEEYQEINKVDNCPDCGYRTYKVFKEQIITSPTENSQGELMKNMECVYCHYKGNKMVKIAKLKSIPHAYSVGK